MSRLGRALRVETRDYTAESVLGSAFDSDVSAAGVSVSTDSAFRHGDVYACIRVIADACATIPLLTYRKSANGRTRVDPLTGKASGVLSRPAPSVTQSALMAATALHLNLTGEAFWAKLRDPAGRVVQLAIIEPWRVERIELFDGEPVYTITAGGGSTMAGRFGRLDVLHIRGLTTNGIRGVSPIAQARDALGVGIALEGAAGRDFANGSYPGAIVELQGVVGDDALKRFELGWNAAHRGARNRGKVAFLEDGWKYQPLGMPAGDAQFVEQRKLSSTQIARIFRVPPYMIGADAGSSMTYSTVEGEMTSFVMHTVRPWLTFIEQAVNADPDLHGDVPGDYVEFLLDAFLRADTQVRYLAYAQADFMSTNDKRRRENLDDVEGGDLVPSVEKLKTAAALAAGKAATTRAEHD